MIDRAAVVQEARALLRTPYHHQGRLPGVGLDCAGVPICVARALGLVAPDFDITGYARQPDGVSLIANCERWMTRVSQAEMQPGDVLVTATENAPNHFGVLADYVHGGLSVIEALGRHDGKGRVIEQRLDENALKRFVAAYRLPGVA